VAAVKLIICRGLPACGKTTRAKAWVAEDPAGRHRVNRDDLRRMLNSSVYSRETEDHIRKLRDQMIETLLRRGVSVISDDTNLPQRTARDLARIARKFGAEVGVWDMTDTPLDRCLERDFWRESSGHSVGDDVIRGMHARFIAGRKYPLPLPEDPPSDSAGPTLYVPDPTLPPAVIVDVDGTVALMQGRGPFEWDRVGEDLPNEAVITVVRALARNRAILFLSGRMDDCRELTAHWLNQNVLQGLGGRRLHLFMRASGDTRKDEIVKLELFDAHVRGKYDVRLVLDDRDRVVRMWRSIGLTCLQVADGEF